MLIFYVATYVACAALPFALLHKEMNFTVNFTSWIWNLLDSSAAFFAVWQKKIFLEALDFFVIFKDSLNF